MKGVGELNFRIKKLKKEIEKSDFKGLIIDRSKTTEEINTQIGVSPGEFQKLKFARESEEQLYEWEEDVLPVGGSDGGSSSCKNGSG